MAKPGSPSSSKLSPDHCTASPPHPAPPARPGVEGPGGAGLAGPYPTAEGIGGLEGGLPEPLLEVPPWLREEPVEPDKGPAGALSQQRKPAETSSLPPKHSRCLSSSPAGRRGRR